MDCNSIENIRLISPPEDHHGQLKTMCRDCKQPVISLVDNLIGEMIKSQFDDEIINNLYWHLAQMIGSQRFSEPISLWVCYSNKVGASITVNDECCSRCQYILTQHKTTGTSTAIWVGTFTFLALLQRDTIICDWTCVRSLMSWESNLTIIFIPEIRVTQNRQDFFNSCFIFVSVVLSGCSSSERRKYALFMSS